MRGLLLVIIVLVCVSAAHATTRYGRNGGGTTTQCTGLANVDYDGSGTGEACAYKNFQDLLNASSCGDTIELHEGQSFLGAFTVPDHSCAGPSYITITTDNSATIPAALSTYPQSFTWDAVNYGTYNKMTTALAAPMPKLVASSSLASPVITFAEGASYYKFIGVEFTNEETINPEEQYNYLMLTAGDTLAELPHHIEFDRIYAHPIEEVGTFTDMGKRSVESWLLFNGSYLTIRNSACYGFTGWNKYPSPGGNYRLNATCVLYGNGPEDASVLLENNVMGSNGNVLFMGGSGGYPNPAHVATVTDIDMDTDSSGCATFSNTTGLDVGDLFSIDDETYGEHYSNGVTHRPPALPAPWVVGGVTSITGASDPKIVCWDFLGGGFRYRQNLFLIGNSNYPGADVTGGTFTLTFNGQTTAPITYDPLTWASDAEVLEDALEALSNIAPGDVDCFWNGDYGMMCNLQGAYAYPATSYLITANDAGMTGTGNHPYIYRNNGPSESFMPVELPDVPNEGAEARWDGYVPSGFIIRRNIFDMPDEWRTATGCGGCPGGIVGEVKAFVEHKQSKDVLYEANIFANRNTGFIITPINQGEGACCPWANTSNFTIRYNLWTESGANVIPFVMEQGQRTVITDNIQIHDNVTFWPIGRKTFESEGTFIRTNQITNVSITHNTVFLQSHIGMNYAIDYGSYPPVPGVDDAATRPMVFRDNLALTGNYYPWGCAGGTFEINCWPIATSTVTNNLFINLFEPGVPESQFDTLFTNWSTGWYLNALPSPLFLNAFPTATQSYGGTTGYKWTWFDPRLNPSSIYAAGNARDASDNKDLGADIPALISAMGFNPFGATVAGGVGVSGKVTLGGNVTIR